MTPEPRTVALWMYARPAGDPPLEWSWVEDQLRTAGTYWVTAHAPAFPHPRPVWGVWVDARLYLSIGSGVLDREIAAEPRVTVHLDSGTDVVIVEGRAAILGPDADLTGFLAAYNPKYDWDYDLATLPPPYLMVPERVMSWRSGGFAGRDGFSQVGKWQLD